jgi:hypothetical protein
MLLPAMFWGGSLPRLVAMTSTTKLAYTYDYKTWTETPDLNLNYDVGVRGVAFNPIDNVLMILCYVTNVSFLTHTTRLTSIKTYDKKSTYSVKGSPAGGYYPNGVTKLFYDSGKWMWGFINSQAALSQNNGTNWTGFNTWSSSTTRNPQVVRYFASANRYITCYPNVQQIGVSPVGSFNNATWSVVATGFTNNTRYVAEGTTGNYLALGGSSTVGQIATSTNLTSWTVRTWITGTPLPNWAVWNGTTWVVVANGGNIATSTNGITWTKQTSPTVNNLTWVDWNSNDNQFVAIGNAMTILTSPNGTTWTQQPVTTTNFLSSTNPIQIARIR